MVHLLISFTTTFELNPSFIVAVVAFNTMVFKLVEQACISFGIAYKVNGNDKLELLPQPKGFLKSLIVCFHIFLVALAFYYVDYDGQRGSPSYIVDLGINACIAVAFYGLLVKFVVRTIEKWADKKRSQ